MAGDGTNGVLLWDGDLWLDGVYPTTVLPKGPTVPSSCRTALDAQGIQRGQA